MFISNPSEFVYNILPERSLGCQKPYFAEQIIMGNQINEGYAVSVDFYF